MRLIQSASAVLGLISFVGVSCNAMASIASAAPSSLIAREQTATGLSKSTVVDLKELIANPKKYEFFTFRPNLEKLILAGTADTKHISILWYTIPDGSVGLHYHSMTESVYTIAGTQTDAKGVYPTGSLYFNPPGSGHQVSNSTGFFLLSYAAPPDFGKTNQIQSYTPVQIDTTVPDLEKRYRFKTVQDGVSVYNIPLHPKGGMSSNFIKTITSQTYTYTGNYLLVLRGSCAIDGRTFGKDTLVVAKTVETQSYSVSAANTTAATNACLVLGLSF